MRGGVIFRVQLVGQGRELGRGATFWEGGLCNFKVCEKSPLHSY